MNNRTIEVPEGCKAVLVSDQFLDRYTEWTAVIPRNIPHPYTNIEIKVEPIDELLIDVATRYVS